MANVRARASYVIHDYIRNIVVDTAMLAQSNSVLKLMEHRGSLEGTNFAIYTLQLTKLSTEGDSNTESDGYKAMVTLLMDTFIRSSNHKEILMHSHCWDISVQV